MKLYRLEQSSSCWGAYGQILMSGLGPSYCGRDNGLITLHRTGPFIPPISLPSRCIVVTDHFRGVLESEFSGLQFQPVIKKRIVLFRWEKWDRTSAEPKRYPRDGEPENYILGKSHSEKASQEMGVLWELVLQKSLEYRFLWSGGDGTSRYGARQITYVLEQSWNGDHFLSLSHPDTVIPIVTDVGKAFLEAHAAEWVAFEEIEVVRELPPKEYEPTCGCE